MKTKRFMDRPIFRASLDASDRLPFTGSHHLSAVDMNIPITHKVSDPIVHRVGDPIAHRTVTDVDGPVTYTVNDPIEHRVDNPPPHPVESDWAGELGELIIFQDP